MKKYIEYVCCSQAPSSSSSTKIFCDGEKLCSPCGCYRCCTSAFFNDHTYSILKRICHKIIKNHSRQRCREHYSVFDGGNSLSIRPLFKGQKDGTGIFNNWMQTKSVFRQHGCRENEDFLMPGLIRNGNGKSFCAWNENMDKNQNSKRRYILGKQNKNNIGKENTNFSKGDHIKLFENHPNKYNEKETKELKKRKDEEDYDKYSSRKSAWVKRSKRNIDINEKFWRDKNQGTTEERDNKNRNSKTKQIKIEKNVAQGEINKNKDNEGKDKKNLTSKAIQPKIEKNVYHGEKNKNEIKEEKYKINRSKAKHLRIEKNVSQAEINKNEVNEEKYGRNITSKAKQTKIDTNLDQDEKNKNEEKEGKYRGHRASKAKQTKIEKNLDEGEKNKNEENEEKNRTNIESKAKKNKIENNVDQSEINRNEDGSKKSNKGKGKRMKELSQYTLREIDNEKDKQKDYQDYKVVKLGKQQVVSKDKHNYEESYMAIPKKNADIFVKKDRVDDKKTQNGNDSAKSKFKTSSGRGSRLFGKESTLFKKATNKEKKSKMLANRKHHNFKGIIGRPRELQSCRYVRPCDVLRVQLEERDLSRCIACCLPSRQYISCSFYQFSLPCGQ